MDLGSFEFIQKELRERKIQRHMYRLVIFADNLSFKEFFGVKKDVL